MIFSTGISYITYEYTYIRTAKQLTLHIYQFYSCDKADDLLSLIFVTNLWIFCPQFPDRG